MRRLRIGTALLIFFSLTISAPLVCRADTPLSLAGVVAAYKHQDLTGLSLNDLADLDIIPVDVTGTHTHLAHQVMLGVRAMTMHMSGYLGGVNSVSLTDVLKQYPVVHTRMTVDTTMFDAMYAPTDSVTLMAMLPYKTLAMDHINRAGVNYATYSSGFGDLSLMGNYTVSGNIRRGGSRVLLIAGVSIPTGSINKYYGTPANPHEILEYTMQTGTGTYNLTTGISYLDDTPGWDYGVQFLATNPLGKNSAGYRVGDAYQVNSWVYYRINSWIGPSVRLEYADIGNVDGIDPRQDTALNPEYDPNQQGGEQLIAIFGLNLYVPQGRYEGNRLTLEYGRPVYQNFIGLQLKEDWQFTLGYSNTFTP